MAEATVDDKLKAVTAEITSLKEQMQTRAEEINAKIDLIAKRIAKATEAEMQMRLLARGIEGYKTWNEVRNGLFRLTELNIAILEAFKGKKD